MEFKKTATYGNLPEAVTFEIREVKTNWVVADIQVPLSLKYNKIKGLRDKTHHL
jgi:hypothetical protein